jgi:hypothetical protein
MWDGLILLCVILSCISCLLSCIVTYVWLWDLCDMCALYIDLYMSCHLVMLICLASALYSDSNKLYVMYSCVFPILWVHCVGLGYISKPNPFVLIVKCLYEPSKLKTSLISFTHTRGGVVINHQKEGDWKHLGPSWVSMINNDTRLLWLMCVL